MIPLTALSNGLHGVSEQTPPETPPASPLEVKVETVVLCAICKQKKPPAQMRTVAHRHVLACSRNEEDVCESCFLKIPLSCSVCDDELFLKENESTAHIQTLIQSRAEPALPPYVNGNPPEPVNRDLIPCSKPCRITAIAIFILAVSGVAVGSAFWK